MLKKYLAKHLKNVVLPLPDSPINETISPLLTLKSNDLINGLSFWKCFSRFLIFKNIYFFDCLIERIESNIIPKIIIVNEYIEIILKKN